MPKVQNSFNESQVADVSKWLDQYEWDFFSTFTTPYKLTLPSARRSMDRLQQRLAKYAGGCRLFWVAEPFDCKEGYHTHGLVYLGDRSLGKRVNPETRTSVDFEILRTSWAVVSKMGIKEARQYHSRYKKDMGAARYLAKYMMKHGSDWDVAGF